MRKRHPEHVNLERWLVSYADFITLLFAFFVIMYAISQADVAKFRAVSKSLSQAFDAGGPLGQVDMKGTTGGASISDFEVKTPQGGRVLDMPAGKVNTAGDDAEILDIKEKLEESVSLELGSTETAEDLSMYYDSEGLVIRLAAKDLFAPGEIEIRTDMKPVIERIGRILMKSTHMVRVEGHADSEEPFPKKYPSAWEFSAARAGAVVKFWTERFNLDAKNFGIAGYGDARPLSRGKAEWDKAKNRRIEIIILNNKFQPNQ